MAKNNNDKKAVKENKKNKHYFKDMKAELKKVVWPTPKQLVNNTVAVIAFTLIIALIVFVLDICFDSLNKYGITALQEKIQSSYSAKSSDNNTVDENSTENNDIQEENSAVEETSNQTDGNEEETINVETNEQ